MLIVNVLCPAILAESFLAANDCQRQQIRERF